VLLTAIFFAPCARFQTFKLWLSQNVPTNLRSVDHRKVELTNLWLRPGPPWGSTDEPHRGVSREPDASTFGSETGHTSERMMAPVMMSKQLDSIR
jgi:hypothetical protein